jgi:hypothetical protein
MEYDMGWWRTPSGGVIGDPPANILDEAGITAIEPDQLPNEVRVAIDRCYLEDFNRLPTEQELRDLLTFCAR